MLVDNLQSKLDSLPVCGSLFAIYDGHLGVGCSEYLEKYLHEAIISGFGTLHTFNDEVR